MLFDIDWQGAQQLYQEAGPDVVRVFILPPTMEELERRLRARNTDSDEVIAARMARAANEISHWDGYDYVLINDDIEGCFEEVKAILRAERLKRRRQIGLIGFARDLIRSVPRTAAGHSATPKAPQRPSEVVDVLRRAVALPFGGFTKHARLALARAYAKGRRHVEATDEYATLLAVAGDAEAGVLRAEMEPILKVLGKLDEDGAP
mgnify:CR=1 FL=1